MPSVIILAIIMLIVIIPNFIKLSVNMLMLAVIMLIVIISNVIKLSVNMRRVSQYALFCYANIKIVLIKLLYSKLMIVVVI